MNAQEKVLEYAKKVSGKDGEELKNVVVKMYTEGYVVERTPCSVKYAEIKRNGREIKLSEITRETKISVVDGKAKNIEETSEKIIVKETL